MFGEMNVPAKNDPDYQAFKALEQQVENGTGPEGIKAGTWVAIFNGVCIASAESFEGLHEVPAMQTVDGDTYVDQVLVEKPVLQIRRGPRLAENKRD